MPLMSHKTPRRIRRIFVSACRPILPCILCVLLLSESKLAGGAIRDADGGIPGGLFMVSRQNLPDHVAMHVRQSSIDSVVAEGQARMVDAEEVQDGGVEVVAVDGGLGAPGPLVALA